MPRLFHLARKKTALPPGTLEFVGEHKVDRVTLSVRDYDADFFEERDLATVADCLPYRDTPRSSWLNINGLHDVDLLRTLGEHFQIHPLILEDILNTQHRPKFEDHGAYAYLVIRMPHIDETLHQVSTEQISIIFGNNYLISFQEREGDVFDAVRERLRSGTGRARKRHADYLAYMLLDAVVDHYFLILERLGDEIEALEKAMVEDPEPGLLQTIYDFKREMILIRRAVWPLREVVSALTRGESNLIEEGTEIFLRDVYDHTVHVADSVESFRDVLSGLQDLYLSSVSNKMNEVMKVLTIIATVFIPLSFLAGIFGMNFDFMPELHWKWSYPVFWGVVLIIAIGMLSYFRRKGWL